MARRNDGLAKAMVGGIPDTEVTSPVLYLVSKHGEGDHCDLDVFVNRRVVEELAFAGHATCLRNALSSAQALVDDLLHNTVTAFTTGGKPC